MTFGCAAFPCATAWFRTFTLLVICLVLFALPLFATVDSGEIIPSSVYVSISSTYDPVNGYSVTFYWQTVHPGNSIVIIENDINYNQNNNSPSRQIVQNDMTTNHVVVVDHFPAYHVFQYWAYYVASYVAMSYPQCPTVRSAICREWATYPGPATPNCSSPPAPGCGGTYSVFQLWNPPNPNNPLVFTMWPIGGQNVYQGDPTQRPACTPTSKSSRECNDLYVVMQANQLDGPPGAVVIMESPVITNLDTGQIVTNNSITAQYLCDLDSPSNPPPQGWDGDYNSSELCYNGTLFSINTTLRLRVNSQAVPGHYQFTGNFQGQLNGQNAGNVNIAYNFTVLPTASFTATPPTTFPAIAGIDTWNNNMVNWGAPPGSANADFWCTNVTDTDPWWSLENGNFSGYMDVPAGYYFEGWNYDGGRIYQQVSDYDIGVFNDHNQNHLTEWQNCAELVLEPYGDTAVGTASGFVQEPNQFPYGLAMNYLRTGNPLYQQAVDYLAHSAAYNAYYSGPVYATSVRVSAYMMDDRLADEITGRARIPAFMLRGVDVMLGYLDQSYNLNFNNPNQQEYDIHPFMVGLAMEALITYYELDLAEGNTPDARIPLEIKKTLDWLEATQYIPQTHTFAYGAYDLPKNPNLVAGTLYEATELNDLVATAWAWYWSKTNNSTYLTQGDDLFSHVWSSGGWTWSVKEYNQVYKWSFDYVRWRSGQNPDGTSPAIETVLPAANPYTGPWTDYSTPVQFIWNPIGYDGDNVATLDPKLEDFASEVVTVTGTTATIYINVFRPNTTMTVYYGTQQPTTCNPSDPQPPYCMQPFPNYGFLNMLQASYPNSSQPGVEVQDPTALSEGITNIYDETVTITGLQPNTTYHWTPLTTDANGNMAAYHDQSFTTLAQ
jgi:hypothetical protein